MTSHDAIIKHLRDVLSDGDGFIQAEARSLMDAYDEVGRENESYRKFVNIDAAQESELRQERDAALARADAAEKEIERLKLLLAEHGFGDTKMCKFEVGLIEAERVLREYAAMPCPNEEPGCECVSEKALAYFVSKERK